MGLKQAIIVGGSVMTAIGVLYRKLDRDSQRHQANLEKTLREGLFRHGMHSGEALAREHPDAIAFDENGKPLSNFDLIKRMGKKAVEDPAKRIKDSIQDGSSDQQQENKTGEW